MRKSWPLLVLLAGCPAAAAQRDVASAPRGDTLLRRTMIERHAATRAAVRQPPLAWDNDLAADALAYAREMARTGRFDHAPLPRGTPTQGENLFNGTRGDYRYDEMVQDWIDERPRFVNRPVPGFSTTGDNRDVAHYAQMIWAKTTRFGCAMASNARDDFLVCRYLPTGMIVGQQALP